MAAERGDAWSELCEREVSAKLRKSLTVEELVVGSWRNCVSMRRWRKWNGGGERKSLTSRSRLRVRA